MKKVVLKYGILAGMIEVVIGFGLMSVLIGGSMANIKYSELIGYTTMIVSLSLIFFGIKAYRDQEQGGVISFGQAVKIGILISLIASAFYVVGWMLYYHLGSGRELMDAYFATTVEELRNSGQPAAEVQAEIDKMEGFREMYQQPIVMIGMTFLEIFPVGLIISLIAAALLKRKGESVVNKGQRANAF